MWPLIVSIILHPLAIACLTLPSGDSGFRQTEHGNGTRSGVSNRTAPNELELSKLIVEAATRVNADPVFRGHNELIEVFVAHGGHGDHNTHLAGMRYFECFFRYTGPRTGYMGDGIEIKFSDRSWSVAIDFNLKGDEETYHGFSWADLQRVLPIQEADRLMTAAGLTHEIYSVNIRQEQHRHLAYSYVFDSPAGPGGGNHERYFLDTATRHITRENLPSVSLTFPLSDNAFRGSGHEHATTMAPLNVTTPPDTPLATLIAKAIQYVNDAPDFRDQTDLINIVVGAGTHMAHVSHMADFREFHIHFRYTGYLPIQAGIGVAYFNGGWLRPYTFALDEKEKQYPGFSWTRLQNQLSIYEADAKMGARHTGDIHAVRISVRDGDLGYLYVFEGPRRPGGQREDGERYFLNLRTRRITRL